MRGDDHPLLHVRVCSSAILQKGLDVEGSTLQGIGGRVGVVTLSLYQHHFLLTVVACVVETECSEGATRWRTKPELRGVVHLGIQHEFILSSESEDDFAVFVEDL